MPKDAEIAQLDLLSGAEKAVPPGPIAQAAFDAWNERAKKFGWPMATVLGNGRPAKLREQVKELGGVHQWSALLDKCGTSDFLCGRAQSVGRKPFTFTLDWLLKPANMLKVREGNYFSHDVRGAQAPLPAPVDPHEADRRKLRLYRPGGHWPAHYGPRPEDADCRLAAPVLTEWREVNRVKVVAPVRETLEERLAGMERSYRKIGNHAKADALLVELSQLRGESLVTLPPRPEPAGTLPSNGAAKRDTSAAVDVEPEYAEIPEGSDFGDE